MSELNQNVILGVLPMDATYHLTKCLNLIQEQLQWGNASTWTNKDFEVLSEKIHDSTSILISYQTLRRLFGKVQTSIQYKPQLETKNALAIFLGFKDWDTFKRAHPLPQPTVLPETPKVIDETEDTSTANTKETEGESAANTKKVSHKTILGSAIITAIAIVGVACFLFFTSAPPIGNIFFKGKNTSGKVPLNVIFHYDISKVKADSIILDFGTEGKKIMLPQKGHTVTMSYLIPGIYKVHMLANNEIIGEETIHAKSEGWSGIIYTENDYFFLQNNSFIKDSTMCYLPIDKGVAQSNLYKPITKADVVEFNNFEDFGVDGDNFIYETRLKIVLPDSGNYCYKAYVKVRGSIYPIRVAFVNKGCNTDALLQIGEVILEGKFHDLSFMGQSFTQWRTVRLEVKNKHVKLFLDNQLLCSIPYKKSIGTIKGLSFRLREFGAVDYVKLYNGQNKLIYKEEFSSPSTKK